MGTHATIAAVQPDGKIKSIYIHYDGYIKGGAGETLLTHYTDPKKVDELINLGSGQSIGSELTAPEAVTRFGFAATFSKEFRALSQTERDRLEKDLYSDTHSVFYHRDRGEDLDIQEFNDLEHFKRSYANGALTQYVYLFMDNQWKVLTQKRVNGVCLDEEYIQRVLDESFNNK